VRRLDIWDGAILLGAACMITGALMIYEPAGWILGGLCLYKIGVTVGSR